MIALGQLVSLKAPSIVIANVFICGRPRMDTPYLSIIWAMQSMRPSLGQCHCAMLVCLAMAYSLIGDWDKILSRVNVTVYHVETTLAQF